MRKPLALIIALSVSLGLLFASAGPADADWGWDDLGTGSLQLNLGNSSVASVDLENCADGKIATWRKSQLTFVIVNLYGLDLHMVQAIRAGVLEWNRAGAPYTLTELKTAGTADITIEVVPIVGLTHLGGANVSCSSGAAGIQSAQIKIGLTGLTAIALQNVSAHEVGHALGLDHATVGGGRVDLMTVNFALISGSTGIICPSNLDVGALKSKTDPYSIKVTSWSMPAAC